MLTSLSQDPVEEPYKKEILELSFDKGDGAIGFGLLGACCHFSS
jgi:hypothetical protein